MSVTHCSSSSNVSKYNIVATQQFQQFPLVSQQLFISILHITVTLHITVDCVESFIYFHYDFYLIVVSILLS